METGDNGRVVVGSGLSRYKNSVVATLDFGNHSGYRGFHLSANTISLYCMPKFFANGKSEFGLFHVTFGVKQNEVVVCNALGMFVYVVVLVVFFQSVNRLHLVPRLRGNSVTPLVATTSKRATTTSGLHSGAETVYFASLTFFGLVSSFHCRFSLLFRPPKGRQIYCFCEGDRRRFDGKHLSTMTYNGIVSKK